MTAFTVEDIPDEVLRAVKAHATQVGQSLQTYALSMFTRDAAQTAPAESVETIGETRGQRAVRMARGSANNLEFQGWTTDQFMEFIRGE
ncbi:hypothetical protein ABIA39_000161 [Nocardia sp. GAS34]|uniref:hypothetical protein n=1 Tax=unclassified Nocardia TaxID=2637762 RepID=UPI003D19F299